MFYILSCIILAHYYRHKSKVSTLFGVREKSTSARKAQKIRLAL